MKKVKVSIQDENTLILQEAAEKGDAIDLKSIHETDIDKTTVTNVVNSIKRDAFNAELEKVRTALAREKALEAKLKEQELLERVAMLEKEKESVVKLAEANAKNQYPKRQGDRDAAAGHQPEGQIRKRTSHQRRDDRLLQGYEGQAFYKDGRGDARTAL